MKRPSTTTEFAQLLSSGQEFTQKNYKPRLQLKPHPQIINAYILLQSGYPSTNCIVFLGKDYLLRIDHSNQVHAKVVLFFSEIDFV